MKYYIYKVEKVDDFKNTAPTIGYDYTVDFVNYVRLRGYLKIDYYISDSNDLEPGEVYCCGNFLIKIIECVTTFEDEPRRIKQIDI